MCLIPRTVNENQPSGIIAGQLIIDDSSSPLSSCAKRHCCPSPQSLGRQFDYQCHVDTPENNEAIPQLQRNVSSLFRLDDGFLLRTKVPLLYSNFKDSNGSVEVHFSCYHTIHPLQFIGQSLQVSVAGAVIVYLFNYSGFHSSVLINSHLLWFRISTLSDWLEISAPLSQPISDSLACVFPRLVLSTFMCFKF